MMLVGSFSPGLPTTNPTDKLLFSSMPRNKGIFRSYLHRINQTFFIYMNFTRKEGFFLSKPNRKKKQPTKTSNSRMQWNCSYNGFMLYVCTIAMCTKVLFSISAKLYVCVFWILSCGRHCLRAFDRVVCYMLVWYTVYVCTTEALTG